tara:strand:- start:11031 stop:11510 length:480 start_codon:yes stop_codon:yes gene_type:complete
METSKDKKLKLNQLNDKKLNKIHLEDLGLKLPEDYFSKSKNEILSKVLNKKEPQLILFSRKRIIWTVAASIALIFSLTIFNQYSNSETYRLPLAVSDTIDQLKVESLPLVLSDSNKALKDDPLNSNSIILKEHDILVKSLFVEDSEMDQYAENYMLEDI